jgi:hypothetical protein
MTEVMLETKYLSYNIHCIVYISKAVVVCFCDSLYYCAAFVCVNFHVLENINEKKEFYFFPFENRGI